MANLKNSDLSLNLSNFTVAVVCDDEWKLGFMNAKFLVKSGVGKIFMFVKSSNESMDENEQTKLKQKLEIKAENSVKVQIFNYADLSDEMNYSDFLSKLKVQSVHLLLCCVNEDETKTGVNNVCNEIGLDWIDCGIMDKNDQVGHVRIIQPGISACLACLQTPSQIDIHEKKEQDQSMLDCGDGINYLHQLSNKTKLCIMADLMSQTATKYLQYVKKEGPMPSAFVKYSTVKDECTKINSLQPNPSCKNVNCLRQQHKIKMNSMNIAMTNHLILDKIFKYDKTVGGCTCNGWTILKRENLGNFRLVCKLWNETLLSSRPPLISLNEDMYQCDDQDFDLICDAMNPKLARKFAGIVPITDSPNRLQKWMEKFNHTVTDISFYFQQHVVQVPILYRLLQKYYPNLLSLSLHFKDEAIFEFQFLEGTVGISPSFYAHLTTSSIPINSLKKLETLNVVYYPFLVENVPGIESSRKLILHQISNLIQFLLDSAPNLKALHIIGTIIPDCSKNTKIKLFMLDSSTHCPAGPLGFDFFSPARLSSLINQISSTVNHLYLSNLEHGFSKFDSISKQDFCLPKKMPNLVSFYCAGAGVDILVNSDQMLKSVLGNRKLGSFTLHSVRRDMDFEEYTKCSSWMERILTSNHFKSSSLTNLSLHWVKNFTILTNCNLTKALFPSLRILIIEKFRDPNGGQQDDAADLDAVLTLGVQLELWELRIRISGPGLQTKWTRIIRSLSGHKELFSGKKLKRFEIAISGKVTDDIWNSGMENRLIEPLFTSMAEMQNVRFTHINPEGRTPQKIIKFCKINKLPVVFQLSL